jgi:hypothetical protein
MTVTEQAPPRQRASEPRIDIDIATTRPGTPGGIFMRQFWHAVCRGRDLPAGSTKPLRIMSEDFAIYRTRAGVPQVVAYRCRLAVRRCISAGSRTRRSAASITAGNLTVAASASSNRPRKRGSPAR